MRLKHKHTGQEMSASYRYWKDSVIENHLEENFNILTSPDIVDVYVINPKNGNKTLVITTDRNHAVDAYLKTNPSYTLFDTTAEFDELYRMTKAPPVIIYKDKKEESKILSNSNVKKIFISHSSKDIQIVGSLIDLLESIGIPEEQIFCTSFAGRGSRLGENFLEKIKSTISDDTLVLFVLSNNFYNSVICLCEMGAAWVSANYQIPILIPPFDFNDIKGVFPNTNAMEINNPSQVTQFKEEIEGVFKIKPKEFSKWEPKRNKIISEINQQLNELVPSVKVEVKQIQNIVPYNKIYRGNYSLGDFYEEMEVAKTLFCEKNDFYRKHITFEKIRESHDQLYMVNNEKFVGTYVTFKVYSDENYICNLDCFINNQMKYMEFFTLQ